MNLPLLYTVNLFVRNVKQPSRRAIHPSKRVNLRVKIGVNATLMGEKGVHNVHTSRTLTALNNGLNCKIKIKILFKSHVK